MGYTTDFEGAFEFSRTLTLEEVNTLNEFAGKRHGDNARPHLGMPGFYCQWVPTDDGKHLEWDGSEKFYQYVDWLKYLDGKFFRKWGVQINGEVFWHGEESDDVGVIKAVDSQITTEAR